MNELFQLFKYIYIDYKNYNSVIIYTNQYMDVD